MQKIFLDFETQSACDLIACGTDVYSRDHTTDVLCMAYAIDDGEIKLWTRSEPFPEEVLAALLQGARLIGHNVAGFEQPIWNHVLVPKYGIPTIKTDQLEDTMAQGNAMGMPGTLDGCGSACGLEVLKDKAGHRVMLQLSQPRKRLDDGTILFWEENDVPEKFQALYEYCKTDVDVTRRLYKRLAPLPEIERKIWLLDRKINDRGVRVDLESVKKAYELTQSEQARLQTRLMYLTANAVPSPAAHLAFKNWVASKGVQTESIDKANVALLLEDETLPFEVREVLLIRQEAAKSSTAKLVAMLNGQVESRLRNMFEYYGAKQTARWAGRRIQLQNMPGSKIDFSYIEDVIENLGRKEVARYIELLYGSPLSVISQCLRALLVPAEGKKFLCADFSNIEGRCLAWLANEEWKVKAFSDFDQGIGHDLYILEYARAFKIDPSKVTKAQRTIGKVITLALGYGGGVGAFQNMAKAYSVKVPDDTADELKVLWRTANPQIVRYWDQVDKAATNAIRNKNFVYSVGEGTRKILFKHSGSFLCVQLPSSRIIYYPYAKIEKIETPWGEERDGITYMAQDPTTKQWQKTNTRGAVMVENLCQAISRDILAAAMLRLEDRGFPVVIHVHDEIVSEVQDSPDFSLKSFESIMAEVPEWAKGFPIAATGWSGYRYRKH